MLTQNCYQSLCTSLHFDVRDNHKDSDIKLGAIRQLVARAFGFESDKEINKYLKHTSISISPEVCREISLILKKRYSVDYYRSPFEFKWPKNIEFTSDEIGSFWRHAFKNKRVRSGADILMMMTPIMQYKRERWIVALESPVSIAQVNSIIGEGLADLEISHTDIIQKLTVRAENGNVGDLYSIALQFLSKGDNANAFPILMKILAIDEHHKDALSAMALIYYEGASDSVKVDFKKAEQLYRKASDLGCAQAAHVLGVSYDLDGAFEQNYEQAFKFLKLAIERGNHASINCLVTMILYNRGVPEDLEPDFLKKLFSKGLELQDPDTIMRIADFYESNGGLEPTTLFDAREACVKISPVTKRANLELARYYRLGFGCTQDIQLAIKHYEIEAEEFGCADAMNMLAAIYREDPHKQSVSLDWLQKAFNAIDSDKDTTHAVEILYQVAHKECSDENFDSAVKLFAKAINFTNTVIDHQEPEHADYTSKLRNSAKLNVGLIQYHHFNLLEGLELIYELSILGDPISQYYLALILINDYGDLNTGKLWLCQSKDNGYEEANKYYDSHFLSQNNYFET